MNTNSEIEKQFEYFKDLEKNGRTNILKYFDRIHDKLFTINNILIAGYFVILKMDKNVSFWTMLIPFANLFFLLFIDYRLMEKSRFEAFITDKNLTDIKTIYGNKIKWTTRFSLLTILTTFLVLVFFLCNLFYNRTH